MFESHRRAAESKKRPEEVVSEGAMSLVVTLWVARAHSLSGTFLPSAPLSWFLALLNVSCPPDQFKLEITP